MTSTVQRDISVADRRRLSAARRLVEHFARAVDLPISVRLWDGSLLPLGTNADPGRFIALEDAGAIGSLLRRPSLETLYRLYAQGRVAVHGDDIMSVLELVQDHRKRLGSRTLARRLRQGFPYLSLLPLYVAAGSPAGGERRYAGDETGYADKRRSNKDLIQFHYDVSNEFYALFLDREMVYSCGYFRDWSNDIDQAQLDKLDLICRKLRLKPGDRFLDIGCGWGALLCHAATGYGVVAEGVTLSQRQYEFAVEKVRRLGLQDRVRISLRDYESLDGTYDKIASIGMYEHIGIANYPEYFKKIMSLLADDGIVLNHGITRRRKLKAQSSGRISPSRQVILKYIFPGSELDDIGHTLQVMEGCGLEVYDVENLRPHYARTCRLWYERLLANETEAVRQVGPEVFRMWLVYLAAVSRSFDQGAMRIYQAVATKNARVAGQVLPPTRADLYR